MIFLDTHVVVWLFAEADRIPSPVRQRIDENELFVSPIVRLELSLLAEVGRVSFPAEAVLNTLRRRGTPAGGRQAARRGDRRPPQVDARSIRPPDRGPRHRLCRSAVHP